MRRAGVGRCGVGWAPTRQGTRVPAQGVSELSSSPLGDGVGPRVSGRGEDLLATVRG